MSNQAEPSYTDLLQENELLKQEINALRLENDDLRRSKFEFQNSAEMQEEYLTNKLMKTIKEMNEQKERLISKINSEEELANCHLAQLTEQKLELENMLESIHSGEKLRELYTENFLLEQQIRKLSEKLAEFNSEKGLYESGKEIEEERHFNIRLGSRNRSTSVPDLPNSSNNSSSQNKTPTPVRRRRRRASSLLRRVPDNVILKGELNYKFQNSEFRSYYFTVLSSGYLEAHKNKEGANAGVSIFNIEIDTVMSANYNVEDNSLMLTTVTNNEKQIHQFKGNPNLPHNLDDWAELIIDLSPNINN
eukprot:TRINITY_DN4189_c0_g1_i2.p1 TRINITY_DN4189_c0_g1~~TRINITY_DN4189_c0_g1_i2.p1  ORF type:complete len:319 (-),score=72.29 TRINITY_DN4189_c0_g1_i2:44-961(-)